MLRTLQSWYLLFLSYGGLMGFGKVRVTNTPTKIVGENYRRHSIILTNGSSSGIVYIGPDDTIASGNAATLLDAFGSLTEDSGGEKMWMGDYYGITTSGAAAVNVFYWERNVSR